MNRSNVDFNIAAHDRIASKYERLHFEIYNPIEQERLLGAIQDARKLLGPGDSPRVALDFGCGSGNLTRKLLATGLNVIASDVSSEFLKLVLAQSDRSRVTPLQLNGSDLREVETSSVDMVATYSVLHHVPDYLKIVHEFVRIVKPGGVIFIDHEKTADYWARRREYSSAYKSMTSLHRRFDKFYRISNYKTWFIRRFMNPRYSPEGDIHVYPDDHIEWNSIDEILVKSGCELVRTEEYLLFRGDFSADRYLELRSKYRDMRLLIAQKPLK